jgi:hypothetical protein
MSKGGNVDFWWGLMEEVVERGRWPPSFGAKHHQNFTIFCYLAPSSSAHGVVGFAPMRPDAGKLPIRQFLPGQIWECFETHVDCNTDSFQPSELAVFTSCRLVWRAPKHSKKQSSGRLSKSIFNGWCIVKYTSHCQKSHHENRPCTTCGVFYITISAEGEASLYHLAQNTYHDVKVIHHQIN